jgi:DNA polymerase III epsilon subunit-like protein
VNLFIDIETTGLPPKGLVTGRTADWKTEYKFFPYILSIAWKIKGVQKYHLVYQEGRGVPKEATAANGITTKMVNDVSKTKPIKFVLHDLLSDGRDCCNVIGHNVYFDTSIIKANAFREFGPHHPSALSFEDMLHKDKRIDTMRSSQIIMGGKWPKLTALYKFLFNEDIIDAHNALADVLATERCYNELRRRKVI